MGQVLGTNFHVDMLNRWTPTNTETDVPRLFQYTNANAISDRFIVPSDYLSFRNLSVGYNLPKKFASRLSISDARLSFAVTNIHLFSYRKGLDPQQSFDGTTDNAYTPLRTSSVALNSQLLIEKIMKKIAIILIVIVGSLASCSKDFLETSPTNQVSDADVFKTAAGAQTVLDGVSRRLRTYTEAHDVFGQKALDLSWDLMGEDIVCRRNSLVYLRLSA